MLALGGVALLWGRTSQVRALPQEVASDTSVEASPSRQTHRHAERRAPRTPESSASVSIGQSVHVALGVPTDSDPSDDYLLDHGVYVLSYNHKKNVANWVAWEVDRAFLGHVRRKNNFRPDSSLPADFYHVAADDYRKSGFDRGHLCPSADREATSEHNSLTFLMTNIQPQLHELNEGPWEKLEEHERELARRRDAEVFIVAGGIFEADYQRIGHDVGVPKASYKIIVALRQGQGASDVNSESKL
jgi:endonuclease G, mitochondrial